LPPEDGRFRQVTDVAWDKDGNWLKSWGERGKEPGQISRERHVAVARAKSR
jgi:hypothetical protein